MDLVVILGTIASVVAAVAAVALLVRDHRAREVAQSRLVTLAPLGMFSSVRSGVPNQAGNSQVQFIYTVTLRNDSAYWIRSCTITLTPTDPDLLTPDPIVLSLGDVDPGQSRTQTPAVAKMLPATEAPWPSPPVVLLVFEDADGVWWQTKPGAHPTRLRRQLT